MLAFNHYRIIVQRVLLAFLMSGQIALAQEPDVPPAFTTQAGCCHTVTSGGSLDLIVEASGTPAPTFQWYQGFRGDMTNPLSGEISGFFQTPALSTNMSYWVRASNTSGSVDSNTISIGIILSGNATLADLALSDGNLTPAFSPSKTFYTTRVPFRTSEISVRGTQAHPGSTLQARMNGGDPVALVSGEMSSALPLNIGSNTVSVTATAANGATKTNSVEVIRATEAADPVYRYDFISEGVLPALAHPGGAFTEYYAVSGEMLRQTTSAVNDHPSFHFPSVVQTGGDFSPAKATFVEARLKVLNVAGVLGAYFDIDDGIYSYMVSFSPGGVYVGSDGIGGDSTKFIPLDTTEFHTYRLESPPNSGVLYFFYDGSLVFTTTSIPSTLNGFGFGDGFASGGNHADADWDYIEFGQTSDYISLPTDANLATLGLSEGGLSPSFHPATTGYTVFVPTQTSAITITPAVAQSAATVMVDGIAVSSGSASAPVPLNPGDNTINVVVTASDLVSTKTYTITVTRRLPPVAVTDPATEVTFSTARLPGSATPNGSAKVYFEYGTSESYGDRTTSQGFAGSGSIDVEATLAGLAGDTTYHYRLVAIGSETTVYGVDQTFTTAVDPPFAATGNPLDTPVAGTKTLVGAVDSHGAPVTVHFEYGLTAVYSQTTETLSFPTGSGLFDAAAEIENLNIGKEYHFRIVAKNGPFISYGKDVTFIASANTGSGTVSPTEAPSVETEGTAGIGTGSSFLLGNVNSKGGTTIIRFEYGETLDYGRFTSPLGIGNSNLDAAVVLAAEGLSPGTRYFYRVVASNSFGAQMGSHGEFTTEYPPPLATSGDATALSTTSITAGGTVQARNTDAMIFIDYGISPDALTNSVAALPPLVSGDLTTDVSGVLANLAQGTTCYYRVRAQRPDGTDVSYGETRSLEISSISNLTQVFPTPLDLADHNAGVMVQLTPGSIGAGWRFAGESRWRLPGSSATGLTSGDRVIEYRPVASHEKPVHETIAVISGQPLLEINRAYTPVASTGSGGLIVTLKPDALAAGTVPAANRARWRMFGENDSQWRDSGEAVSGLVPGDYVIECQTVPGRTAPSSVNVVVSDGANTSPVIAYVLTESPVGSPPDVLDFTTISTTQDRPFAYAGGIRSDAGSSSGFVVRPRVVATAGHVVFDDASLAAATGLEWLFQRDRDVHEPLPQIPRGYYLMSGYAAQRTAENSPGTSTPQSQNLDAAALYFSADAGRGGYSGYFASDSTANEFLLSSALKTLVGYPVDGIALGSQGRMHASPISNVTFAQGFGRTYITTDIHTSGGNSGGPLCVRHSDANYYPAAIYLGGSDQTVVRAIDSDVAALFGFAEVSGSSDAGNTGGSLTGTVNSEIETPTLGAVEVFIEPAVARYAGAGWKIHAQDLYQASGTRQDGLDPNDYAIQFATVSGFLPPAHPTVTITAGTLTTLTFTYEQVIPPPVISSPPAITVSRGETVNYQIVGSNSPIAYFVQGVLPAGVSFDAASGLLSGTLDETGMSLLTLGATNAGGVATLDVILNSLPMVLDQATTVSYQQPMSYRVASSETGGQNVIYTAIGLPTGLSLDESTGIITGIPSSGSFIVPISVTHRELTASANLTIHVSGTPPVFTTQPIESRSIAHSSSTTLTLAVSGLPSPAIQWYRGTSGVTTQPIAGATSSSFTTPPLTASASYWARASSISGSTNSTTSVITVLPSTNAKLADLAIGSGNFSPSFNSSIFAYTAIVPFAVSDLSITPTVEAHPSTVRLGGTLIASGVAAPPVNLVLGLNVFEIEVTAGDGTTSMTYTLTVQREEPATACTGDPISITDSTALLQGTVNPRGGARAFFQYGLTTSYGNAAPFQDLSGAEMLTVQAPLGGLSGNTMYHYRIGVITGAGTSYGEDRIFTTSASPPLAATGNPASVTATGATLVGSVNPRGLATDVHFEYGTTPDLLTSTSTAVQSFSAETSVSDVIAVLDDLIENTTYYYKMVASSPAGLAGGDTVQFIATLGTNTGDGLADISPTVTTGEFSDLTTSSVMLQGSVNPKDGTTQVHFDYGLTNDYGFSTVIKGIGNGVDPAAVALEANGLLPGTTYHYRIVAENSKGVSFGEDAVFTSTFLPPVAVTGDAEAASTGIAIVHGTVRPQGEVTDVYFDYGIDGVNFPNSIRAFPGTLSGTEEIPVSITFPELRDEITYYYRVRAVSPAGTIDGGVHRLQVGALIGLIQQAPRDVSAGERDGSLLVNLFPEDTGAWRFIGEPEWREAGVAVSGLATGEREIEFRPVAGFIQPASEIVASVSGEAQVLVERNYYESSAPGTGTLVVILEPSTETTAQWRLDGSDVSHNSGDAVIELLSGNYRVDFDAVPGRDSPPARNVRVKDGETSTITATYLAAAMPTADPPVLQPFTSAANSANMPYGYVGQIRTATGTHSGFVVKPRVVATVAQAVFDEDSLSIISGVQWLLQRDRGIYEPKPQIPRGFFAYTGYAAGSQDLNVAALYFGEDAGRGGFSGFLASDETENPYLQNSSMKTLVGYPVSGIDPSAHGRMHATPPGNGEFIWSLGRTFMTTDLRGVAGMTGGPLCVQRDGGAYYPAAIHVGGTNPSAFRAIDSSVIDLFTRAAISGGGGDDHTGGGITHSGFSSIGSSGNPGSLKITIEPAAARNSGAGWRLKPETSYRSSGNQKSNLKAGSYILQLTTVEGFAAPARQTIVIHGGQLSEYTFTYQAGNTAPTIAAIGNRTIQEDGSTGPIGYTIGDDESAAASLTVTRASSNTVLVPVANIVIGGSGASRTVAITPAPNQSGTATVTLTVSDGELTASESFTLTVSPVNDAPFLTVPEDQDITLNSSTATLTIDIGDVETVASSLSLTATSSNVTLVSVSGIVLGGSGTNRTVKINTASGQLGTTTIELTVSDGAKTAATTFEVRVTGTPVETWRFANFGNANDSGISGDLEDADGDGSTNRAEYAAGTDPNDSADTFRVSAITRSGNAFRVTVSGKTGRSYALERNAAPGEGSWTPAASQGPLSEAGEVNLEDAAPPVGKAFYRVKVVGP